jgi:hypothetical protein
VLLDLEPVQPCGPVPAELLQRFAAGEPCQPHAALGGPSAPPGASPSASLAQYSTGGHIVWAAWVASAA